MTAPPVTESKKDDLVRSSPWGLPAPKQEAESLYAMEVSEEFEWPASALAIQAGPPLSCSRSRSSVTSRVTSR